MTPADRAPFLEVILGFAELKGKQLSTPALELYWRSMQDWELDDFREAAQHLLRRCEFMPIPKDFEDLRRAAKGTPGDMWAQAVFIAATGGYRNGEKIDDEAADRAIKALGGYAAIGRCDEDKLHFLERRFLEYYESMSESDSVRAAIPSLEGIAFSPLVKKLTAQY